MDQAKQRKLKMTPEEIRRSFNEAAKKGEQITILAELNLCSKDEIKEVLLEQGVPETEIPKQGRRRKEAGEKKEGSKKKVDVPPEVRTAVVLRMEQLTDELTAKEKELKTLSEFFKQTEGTA